MFTCINYYDDSHHDYNSLRNKRFDFQWQQLHSQQHPAEDYQWWVSAPTYQSLSGTPPLQNTLISSFHYYVLEGDQAGPHPTYTGSLLPVQWSDSSSSLVDSL